MAKDQPSLFTKLLPVLNVRDVSAERAFYLSLGFMVTYEGKEYPDFIALGVGDIEFGIQPAKSENDPPSVLTWQIGVSDVDRAIEVCEKAALKFEIEHNDPAPGWSYRRLILTSPNGYRVALEGDNEK
jgi:hypothetical protein